MDHIGTAALVQIAKHRDGNDDRRQKYTDRFGHACEMISYYLPWLYVAAILHII